ncbi:unnamed protein product [Cylicocyclus nassatus]|uniref:Uncharacterized protein n=1 Tax=Cylicocyclus nassatus TaxID=53992 RepID=A0AA36MGD3_CYLNA|nr:unnamed protein product [Cylicocyclus nassatus]CAJ0608247.1 unnamed protein product [Cylicocyclus nassatus]CAJ0608252.1 unnamed protein product [Cylicocyclus nassatus]CAJ0609185.1 unnamed protein product [Cylicocyclus nassatus]
MPGAILVAFLRDHFALSENCDPACPQVTEYHKYAIEHFFQPSSRRVEIFKVCSDYWCALTSELYRLNPFTVPSPPIISFSCRDTSVQKNIRGGSCTKSTDQICVLS